MADSLISSRKSARRKSWRSASPRCRARWCSPTAVSTSCTGGHVTYLAQARSAGAAMVLALNTDASVRRLGKGSDRPINPLADRAAVAAALACVDLVTWFDEDTPAALIETVKPDILIKGGDWPPEKIVGAAQTLARGGQVFSIPFLHQTSTTKTLEKIRASERG